MLKKLQLLPLADRRPDQLSGGQQQRVALGRALAITPALLLLDEPLTALDAQLRESLRAELRRTLEQFHTTSIYVTHDQAEAMSLGDRIVVMCNGQIEQVGTPHEVYQRPASAFVAQFIGNANRIHGTLQTTLQGPQAKTALGVFAVAGMAAQCTNGTAIHVFVRPEDIAVVPPAQANVIATVQRIEFLGDRLRLHTQTTTGETLFVLVEAHTTIPTDTIGLQIRQTVALPAGNVP